MALPTIQWRWIVLVAAVCSMILNVSISFHVGVLYVAILDTFNSDPFITSWLVSVYGSLYAFAAPLGSTVINITNCRTCIILSGIFGMVGFVSSAFVTQLEWLFLTLNIAAIGQSLALMGSTVALAYNFPDMMPIANGISLTGGSLGIFIHPIILQLLVDEYTLRGAFLILGGMALNSCVCGMCFRPTALEVKQREEKKSSSPCLKTVSDEIVGHIIVLAHPAFASLVLAVFTYAVAFQSALLYLPEYLITVTGLTHGEASVGASLLGVGAVISRPLVGFAANDPHIGSEIMFIGVNAMSFLLCLLARLLLSFHAGVYLFAFALGCYSCAVPPLIYPITFRILGFQKGATGCGVVLLASGLGSLVGPPICATLVESFAYDVLFDVSALLFLLTSALEVCSYLLHQRLVDSDHQADGTSPALHTDEFKTDQNIRSMELEISSSDLSKMSRDLDGISGNDSECQPFITNLRKDDIELQTRALKVDHQ